MRADIQPGNHPTYFSETISIPKRQEAGRSALLAAICRHKVTVDEPLTPYYRSTPMGIGGTPRTGNASEDWQRLR